MQARLALHAVFAACFDAHGFARLHVKGCGEDAQDAVCLAVGVGFFDDSEPSAIIVDATDFADIALVEGDLNLALCFGGDWSSNRRFAAWLRPAWGFARSYGA